MFPLSVSMPEVPPRNKPSPQEATESEAATELSMDTVLLADTVVSEAMAQPVTVVSAMAASDMVPAMATSMATE